MPTTTSTDFGAILNDAIQGAYVAHLGGQTYTITAPIVIHVTRTTQGALGIDGGGATLVSQVTNGAPLIQIVVDPGVDFRYLTLSNFTIAGNGREGDGIRIVADGNDRWLYNWTIDNVTVQHVGGYGLDVQGSVFEGSVSDSWMVGNAKGGAYFAHSAGGGQASALHWFGGGFQDNGGAGLMLDRGTRDMSVDSASVVNNNGPGISALWGISSVSASTFQDNHGPGVSFQNYGNFNNNTFTTSGAQSIGIKGYLAGEATLIGNTSTYTGAGPDPTTLADLQGNGGAFLASDSGKIVTGSSVAVNGVGGGNDAHVVVDSHGVALPTLPAVTAATTADMPSSTGTQALESALQAAIAGGTVAHLTDTTTYTVTTPIVINITRSIQSETGIDLGGAKIISHIAGGGPVIEFIVAPGVEVSRLTLSNFSVIGTGGEGDGIKIVADGRDRAIRDLDISNVNVEHVGGIGLDVLGNVSHATVLDSWMHGNGQGGARFANSAGGGVASGLEWTGGGFRKNGGAGLILDNGTHDMAVRGAYFVENNGPGLYAASGIALVRDSGFENNQGVGAIVGNSANFTDVGFSTYGPQKTGIGGFLAGGEVTLTGVGGEYYGSGADPTVLANVQGNGTLAIAGGGQIVAGPHVTITGGNPKISVPHEPGSGDTTAPVPLSVATSGLGIDAGTGDLNAGKTVTLTVTFSEAVAVAGGTPTMLLNDGGTAVYAGGSGGSTLTFIHTVQAGQNIADLAVTAISLNGATIKDGAGNAANLSPAASYNPAGILRIDTTAPVVTEHLSGDIITSILNISTTGALAGTADPHGLVHFTIDGHAAAATATADASGAWSYTPSGLADGQHTIVASQTDAAGNSGSASLSFTLASGLPVSLPPLIGKLAGDPGSPSSNGTASNDAIPSTPAPTGAAPSKVAPHATIDSTPIDAIATGDAGRAWSFISTAKGDGRHTIVVSDADPMGTASTTKLGSSPDQHGKTGPGVTATGSDGHSSSAAAGGDFVKGNGGGDKITGGAGADTPNGGTGKVPFGHATGTDPMSTDSRGHGFDKIDVSSIAGMATSQGVPPFMGKPTDNPTLNAHSPASMPETVTSIDSHASDMEIGLLGVKLHAASDFHHS